jgi:hypothetical protein
MEVLFSFSLSFLTTFLIAKYVDYGDNVNAILEAQEADKGSLNAPSNIGFREDLGIPWDNGSQNTPISDRDSVEYLDLYNFPPYRMVAVDPPRYSANVMDGASGARCPGGVKECIKGVWCDCEVLCGPGFEQVVVSNINEKIIVGNRVLDMGSYCVRVGAMRPKLPSWKYTAVASLDGNDSNPRGSWTAVDNYPHFPINMCQVLGLSSVENAKNILFDYQTLQPINVIDQYKVQEKFNLYDMLPDALPRYRCQCNGRTNMNQRTINLPEFPGKCFLDPCTSGIPFAAANGFDGEFCDCGTIERPSSLGHIVGHDTATPCSSYPNTISSNTVPLGGTNDGYNAGYTEPLVKNDRNNPHIISVQTRCWADYDATFLSISKLYPCHPNMQKDFRTIPQMGTALFPPIFAVESHGEAFELMTYF